jgi:hypothetical protein
MVYCLTNNLETAPPMDFICGPTSVICSTLQRLFMANVALMQAPGPGTTTATATPCDKLFLRVKEMAK